LGENPMLLMIERMYGSEARTVLEYLLGKNKEVTDEEIAEETGLKINSVRRALYLLLEHNLVGYRRVRDRNSGWYIYYWQVNVDQINAILYARKKMVLEKLKARLRYEESNEFYVCPNDGSRYTFDEAMDNDFRCPRCGEMLEYEDNTRYKEVLRKRIARIEEELRREAKLLSG
jgi:transcription initiation factor TFIIE subunit alpha